MAKGSRVKGKGPLWHGYRRPVWRDGVFWLGFGTGIVGLIVQNAFANFEATTTGWVILGIEVVFTFAVALALIGVLAGTLRGFGEGWRQAEKAASPRGPAARPAKATPEPKAKHEPKAKATPEPTTPATPEPVVEVMAATEPEGVPPVTADEPSAPTVEPEPAPDPRPEPEPVAAVASDPKPSDRPKAGVEMERQARRLGRAIGAGRRTYKKYDKD